MEKNESWQVKLKALLKKPSLKKKLWEERRYFEEKRKLASKTESSFKRAFFELFRKDLGENEKEALGRKKILWRENEERSSAITLQKEEFI